MSHYLFSSQKAMRQYRQSALRRGLIAVLDIGSSKISCLILQTNPDLQSDFNSSVGHLYGHGAFKVIGAATTRSRGVEFGEIVSMEETERAIRTALQSAQKMAHSRVDYVVVSFSGGDPRSYGVTGTVPIEHGDIREQDIANVLAACDLPNFGANRTILHALPVNFAIDNRTGFTDPRGQIGNELSVDVHILTVDDQTVHNILRCVRRCDMEVAGLVSGAYASGLSALMEDEWALGAACVDIGGGTTGLSIFMKKQLIYCETVTMGSDHVTSDISMALGIPLEEAERIKTMRGGLVATGVDDRDVIDIGGDNSKWHGERRRISRSELIGVIRPRMEEILEEVRLRLDVAGFEHLQSQHITLTGGGSQIEGLDSLARKILGGRIRLGKPMRVNGLPHATSAPAFSALVGLALQAVSPQDECWDFDLPLDAGRGLKVKQAFRWFKANW